MIKVRDLHKLLHACSPDSIVLVQELGLHSEVYSIEVGTCREIVDNERRPGEVRDYEFVPATIGYIKDGQPAVRIS